MTPRERLAAADARMTELLSGAETVSAAAERLLGDGSKLSWLPIDLGKGDLRGTLLRVSRLPADEVIDAYYRLLRQDALRADTAYYAAQTAADNAAAMERGAPRQRRDDD